MTYEEYFNLVKKGLDHYLKPYNLTDEQIIEYMHKHEDYIREEYEDDLDEFNDGIITINEFREGSVSGVVYTLHLLY